MSNNNSDMGLLKLLKWFGIKKIIISTDTLIFLVISISSLYFVKKIEFVNWLELSEKFLNISITIGIGSLAMVLTALSIIASMFSEKFSNIVNQANAYFDFTVPFLLSALIWICVVLLSLLGIILIHINDTKILIIYIISFTSGFLVSGFKSIIDLIITSIKLGYYKNKIINK